MMNEEEGNTLYDVRNRLCHRSIQTTERIYDHLLKVCSVSERNHISASNHGINIHHRKLGLFPHLFDHLFLL